MSQIVIIGAGPGGLACAKTLAKGGADVLVIERKAEIGPKVCAGGITWSGLIKRVPEHLIEREFKMQYIFSPWQCAVLRADQPMVATVDRRVLGRHMAAEAQQAGARLLTGTRVLNIHPDRVEATGADGGIRCFPYDQLVGADGSNSLVRRHLGVPSERVGVGINYQLPERRERMEWHLNPRLFGNGYAWIFPHGESVSVGAYADRAHMSPLLLGRRLRKWASRREIDLDEIKPSAETINFDYRGHRFDRVSLVGDAAGLASGLTGEGIYPAMVSGECVGREILGLADDGRMARLIAKQRSHTQVLDRAGRGRWRCVALMELLLLLLRVGLIKFERLEMAD